MSVALVSREVLLDNSAALVTHLGDVVTACVFNGSMEGEGDGSWSDVKSAARHDLVAAIDGNGDNR